MSNNEQRATDDESRITIDFYILSGATANGRERLACRLTEKIYKLGHKIHIHTESASQAKMMDDLLWSYKAGSFLPHVIQPDNQHNEMDAATPIVVGCDAESDCQGDVLINLAADVPLFFSRFERVAEIVSQEQQHKASARERYRFYRDRGHTLKSHNISA